MRTYEQDLKELNISAEEFDNIISHIYDKTAEEMATLAKAIKSGARVLPTVKRTFERVLAMRQEERREAYDIYYSDLNTMCYSCKNVAKSAKEQIAKHGLDAHIKNFKPKRSALERQPRDDRPALMMADQRMEEEGYDERNLCNLQQ